ncbi:MAG: amidophosphoribosyltransferase [Clostridia bacterium]|nr:amidophosphoribosyltransferase [Clostridia bacterium]
MTKLHEECGVFGIYDMSGTLDCARLTYYALYALQHRGQEACGIAVCRKDGEFACHKDVGLVPEVFGSYDFSRIEGKSAVGHVRYSGSAENRSYSQPLVSKYKKGTMAIANGGGLINRDVLVADLEERGAIFHTDTDAEIISYLVAKARAQKHSLEDALHDVMDMLEGAYSTVVMTPRKIVAVRDPHGFRPLAIGKIEGAYIVCSETVALNAIGAEFVRDVKPGEIVILDENGITSIDDKVGTKRISPCIFEYIYFARPDSVIDSQSVYEARKLAGKCLARSAPVEADIVIGVPDSGLCAAIGYAEESKIPYGYGLIKNRYITRTFIQPSQKQREESVRIKLNALAECVSDKRVVMVDDSIVRGTTSKNIITLLKNAGAKEVHVRISSPPFVWPCFFGTDIPSRKHLAGVKYTQEEIRQNLGADSLGFLRFEDLPSIIPNTDGNFCAACFSGDYPVHVPPERLE